MCAKYFARLGRWQQACNTGDVCKHPCVFKPLALNPENPDDFVMIPVTDLVRFWQDSEPRHLQQCMGCGLDQTLFHSHCDFARHDWLAAVQIATSMLASPPLANGPIDADAVRRSTRASVHDDTFRRRDHVAAH